MNALTDNALMLGVKAGDMNRMGLLFERYHRELFGFLYHISHNPDASEDMVQTVFYRMLKYRHTFTGEGQFRTWMYHVARNVLVDAKQQYNSSAHHRDVAEYADRIGGGLLADEVLQKEEEAATLKDVPTKTSQFILTSSATTQIQ